MIWVLLFTLLIKLMGTADEVFTIPKLKKEIRTHVSDKVRKNSLLLIVKEAKKKNKGFIKATDKDKKKLKKLMASGENEIQEIETLLKNNHNKRKKLQNYNLEKRLDMQNLMTDEEWEQVIEKAVSPSKKREKKTDKEEKKVKDAIDKLLEKTEKSILKNIEDSTNRDHVLKAFRDFSNALKEQVSKGLENNYQNNKIVRKRTATREELEEVYGQQNELRENLNVEFTDIYNILYEHTNKKERKSIKKELNKMFK